MTLKLLLVVVIQRTSNCKSGSVCCDNTRVPVTQRPRPTTRRPTTTTPPPAPTSPPDSREECPGSCIVSLLSFTCFRNAEMTDLFKCKKSGTQCCAPKTKIQEQLDKHNRNHTYQYNPNLGPVNPNYPHQQQQYYNNYPPPPPPPPANNGYPSIPPNNYAPVPPNNYPPPPHVYEPTIPPPQSSIPYEIIEPSTSQRPAPYSKYVCGVKGTIRAAKEYLVLEGNSTARSRRSHEFRRDNSDFFKTKTNERLVLGSSLVPIQIVYDDNSTFSFDLPHQRTRSPSTSHRQARVVGGEDGDNGEWCWQVALINAQNQYLCGGALIGEKFDSFVKNSYQLLIIFSRNSMGIDSSSLCDKHCSIWRCYLR